MNGADWAQDKKNVEKLAAALWRIADVVKKIEAVTERREVEYQQYAGLSKMIKVR